MKKLLKKDNILTYDGNFLKEYYDTVKGLIKSNCFMLFLLGISFLTYGFYLYFHAIGADDLDRDRFFVEYGLIRQGRFVGQILHEVFDIMWNHAFLQWLLQSFSLLLHLFLQQLC